LRDGVSQSFKHLEGADLVKRTFLEDCDLYIAVDCSDNSRIGGVLDGKRIGINIDHHITNDGFGEVNLIDDKAVATCSILAEHMPKWGLSINKSVAAALLSGILSDSIGFRTSNTSARSLRIAADLMELGADISSLYNKALISRSFEAANYWGYALGRLERENGLVWTSLTLEDRRSSKYPGNDDADLTNILSSIDDMDIAVLFVEQRPDKVKVSWRARPGLDVSGIAASLGGGGHSAAAGADLSGNMDEVKQKVIDLTRSFLDQAGNGLGDAEQASKTE
jgi:bifunctional oligoribonuclease and PAP phosphatase NrnA